MNAAHVSQPVNQPGKPEKQRSDYGCRLAACLGNNFMRSTLDPSKLHKVRCAEESNLASAKDRPP